MENFVLSCCSTADLSVQHMQARNLSYVCFHYQLDGVEYVDDLGQSMPFDKFYAAMEAGADTKTAQVNVDEYLEYFKSLLEQGKDVLHVSLSSGISGSYNSACIAAEELRPQYPDRKLYVVDSLNASSGFGLLMDRMADLRDAGMTIDELYSWAEENKKYCHAWFFSTDLTFFVKGGRVSKVSGWFGTALKICPLLHIDAQGKLLPRKKVRGKAAVIDKMVDTMEEMVQDGLDYNGKVYISHSACYEDAEKVAELIEARFSALNGRVLINNIGTTIGSHTGPGTVALFFWGKDRNQDME